MANVWISDVTSNYELGDKQGTREKRFNEEWAPADFILPAASDEQLETMRLYFEGVPLTRERFPEAIAVWNEKAFSKKKELFFTTGLIIVRGELANLLRNANLGDGELIPFKLLKSDLETELRENCYFWSLGNSKNTFSSEQSISVRHYLTHPQTGFKSWRIRGDAKDGDLVFRADALNGPDVWVEPALPSKILFSDALGAQLAKLPIANDLRLRIGRVA